MQYLRRYVLLLVLYFSPLGVGAQEPGSYLVDRLRTPIYLQTFNALFANEPNLEPWLQRYLQQHDGVDNPVETRTVQDHVYELYHVCQPHNCPGNVLYVLYVPGGARAWALFTKDDGTSRFFGHPDPAMEKVLRTAVNAIPGEMP